ncbi:MAG: 4-hydroxybutyrate CoA-transferase [Gammaproteobacteria bacterium]|jgi:4-hydroxybutyrate CoA-transferase
MKLVKPADAVAEIPDHSIAIMPAGCARATNFYSALMDDIERFTDLTLCSGFSFGTYPYLEKGLGRNSRYLTWQASANTRALFKEGDRSKYGFVPIRLADVHRVVSDTGEIRPHTVVVQTSLPQADGRVSLGISVGANLDFIRSAKLVIAEMNPNMPVTSGDSRVSLESIDLAYEADTPLWEYSTPAGQASDEQIVENVMSLIPDGAWAQLGVGAVPDRILERLSEVPGINLWSGLLTGGLQQFIDKAPGGARIVAGELAGSKAFYEFCNQNARIEMAPTSVTHDVAKVGSLPKFVSVNSALEIDLQGQSNGEAIGKLQISGVGGSLDYIEAANLSEGGISIIALTSTTANGKYSKIVPNFLEGAVVTTPRYCTDCVVTEYGIARLRGKDLFQRAEALIAIAHPDFRDQLAGALR